MCETATCFHPVPQPRKDQKERVQPHLLFLRWGRPVLGLGGLKLLGSRGVVLARVRMGEL